MTSQQLSLPSFPGKIIDLNNSSKAQLTVFLAWQAASDRMFLRTEIFLKNVIIYSFNFQSLQTILDFLC